MDVIGPSAMAAASMLVVANEANLVPGAAAKAFNTAKRDLEHAIVSLAKARETYREHHSDLWVPRPAVQRHHR